MKISIRNAWDETIYKYKLNRKLYLLFEVDGLVQNRSISIANALEILQSCTNPSKKVWYPFFLDIWLSIV